MSGTTRYDTNLDSQWIIWETVKKKKKDLLIILQQAHSTTTSKCLSKLRKNHNWVFWFFFAPVALESSLGLRSPGTTCPKFALHSNLRASFKGWSENKERKQRKQLLSNYGTVSFLTSWFMEITWQSCPTGHTYPPFLIPWGTPKALP